MFIGCKQTQIDCETLSCVPCSPSLNTYRCLQRHFILTVGPRFLRGPSFDGAILAQVCRACVVRCGAVYAGGSPPSDSRDTSNDRASLSADDMMFLHASPSCGPGDAAEGCRPVHVQIPFTFYGFTSVQSLLHNCSCLGRPVALAFPVCLPATAGSGDGQQSK